MHWCSRPATWRPGRIPEGFGPAFFWGIVASGITGWFAVWGMLRLIKTHTFTPFVVYRIVLGVSVLCIYGYRSL